MSRTHFIACRTCRQIARLGNLLDRRPDLNDVEEREVWQPELQAAVNFLAAHVTYRADQPHSLVILDDDAMEY